MTYIVPGIRPSVLQLLAICGLIPSLPTYVRHGARKELE